ncbi:MAG: DUF935 family protein [Bacteroidales bacterium]|nr:DUF935 family protein [Bacteroidales bacterium]
MKWIDKYISKAVVRELSVKKKDPNLQRAPIDSVEWDFFKTAPSLWRKEVDDWKQAREARRDPHNPVTYLLQQTYADNMIDRVLFRQISNRVLRITNKQFLLKKPDGTTNWTTTNFINQKWFRKLVKQALLSKFYGYSMVYINRWAPGAIQDHIVIPREHLIPEKNLLIKNITDRTGLTYTDFPNFLIYMSLGDDAIGELEGIGPLTILKRHSWASWDAFEQIFGLPLRIAKTMVNTPKHLNELQSALDQMGRDGSMIIDKMVDIEYKESTRTDAFRVFDEKRKAVNEEICVAVNGETMTTFDGSSRSQGEVHLLTLEEITAEDVKDVQDWFNNEFIHVLRNLSYPIPEGEYIQIASSSIIKPVDRIKIDESISKMGFNIDPGFIEDTYDVVLDKENPRSQGYRDPNQLSFFV